MGTSSVATLERQHAASSQEADTAQGPDGPCADPLWRVWPGREWPASGDEERALLADLELRAPGAEPLTPINRAAVT